MGTPIDKTTDLWSPFQIEVLMKVFQTENWKELNISKIEIWKKIANEIGLDNPDSYDYETFKEKIRILFEEAKLFNITFTHTPFEMIQNLKELNDKVCKINHDIFKLWAAIYQQAPAKPGFTINKPDNIWLYNLHEIIEAFDSWITLNKDKIADNYFTLDLSSLALSYLPPSIGRFTNLKELNLSNNKLTNLPDSIGNLINLTNLILYKNLLQRLPNTFGNLTNLKELNLSYNKLTKLHDNFGNLTNLNELNLNYNCLKQLPYTFKKLINLKFLNLYHNMLTEKPDITNFAKLTNFCIGENPLDEISIKRKRSGDATD